MTNDELYIIAIDAIRDLFNDDSVTADEAKGNLQGLMDEIATLNESLEVLNEAP